MQQRHARESDDAEGVEGVEDAIGGGQPVEIVLHVRLLAVVQRDADGDGRVAERHDGGRKADRPQVIEILQLQATQWNSVRVVSGPTISFLSHDIIEPFSNVA